MTIRVLLLILFLPGTIAHAQQEHTQPAQELLTEEIDKIISQKSVKLLGEYAKHGRKKSTYLLSYKVVGKEETMKALIEANACINLRNMRVLGGETHEIEEDTISQDETSHNFNKNMTKNDFYRLIQLAPMIEGESYWKFTYTPFSRREIFRDANSLNVSANHGGRSNPGAYPQSDVYYGRVYSGYTEEGEPYKETRHIANEASERYEVSGKRINNRGGEEDTLQIDLRPIHPALTVAGIVSLTGKKDLLSFNGELLGKIIWVMKEGIRQAVRLNCHFKIDYTHHRGFTEVEHYFCTINDGTEETIIELFNLGNNKLKSKKKVPLDGNLPEAIRKAGYNPALWENEAVKKAIEESTNNYQQ